MKRAKILLLPTELRNQIAAGEVVERPASVVKELVENALDAHATEIIVCMEDGGQGLISVQDNGIGIPAEELELAVTRHATSKLQTSSDLSHILSFGFRGEALPSIASVARFRIVSKTVEDSMAHELTVNFGDIQPHSPATLRQGTLIEVRDLFFNIPARLKFLKNPATELKRATDLFVRLALAADNVGMSLSSGSRTLHEFFDFEDKKAKLAKIWPSTIIEELMPVDTELHGIKIHGYISNPRSVQPRSDRMLLYVNGRAVNDKILLKAVRQAYAGKITTRDYPQCLLFLEIDPQEVDVNVHPAKSEVRFRDERMLFSVMAKAVDNALSACSSYFSARNLQEIDENASVSQAKFGDLYTLTPKPQGFWGNADRETRLSFGKEKNNAVSADVTEYFKTSINSDQNTKASENVTYNSITNAMDMPDKKFSHLKNFDHVLLSDNLGYLQGQQVQEPAEAIPPLSHNFNEVSSDVSRSCGISEERQFLTEKEGDTASSSFGLSNSDDYAAYKVTQTESAGAELPYGLEYMGQIAETYLVLKKDNDTLLLLDQHAAHERILYEEMKKGEVQCQPLLCPLELPLHACEVLRFEEMKDTLNALGFGICEKVDLKQSVLEISAIPQRYDRVEAMGFLKEILAEKLDSLDTVWIRHACRTAIKANTPLDRASAMKLILQWLKTKEPDNCPHGRPCVVHFDSLDLEKLFKRKF